jgi:hypothetical protein
MRRHLPGKAYRMRLVAVAMLLSWVAAGVAAASPLPVAVPDFTFSDTSGEARDQRAEHEARLQALAAGLRADLAASGQFRIVDIACGSQPCTAEVSQALEQAGKAGARFVVLVGVHKTSSLILSCPVQVIDTGSGKVVFRRFHSFRGDTDEAWLRVGRFLARELIAALAGKQ